MKELLLDNDELKVELENGILIGKWKSASLDLNKAQLAVKYRLECSDNNLYPILSDIQSVKHITKEARDFLASKKGSEGISRCALLTNSPIGAMIGNFFISFNRPLVPIKMFADEDTAKDWLLNFKN